MPLTLKMTWRTRDDSEVCPICRKLEGYTWFIEVGNSYPEQLVHPLYGPVYDTRPAANCSLVQEKKGHVCRCTIESEFCLFNVVAGDGGVLASTSGKQQHKKLVEQ